MSEANQKKMVPHHGANILALVAENFFTNIDAICDAFAEGGDSLDITFKAVLSSYKDEVKIQFKPVAEIKDSATAMVPDIDPEQPEFGTDENGDFNGENQVHLEIKCEPTEEEPIEHDAEDNPIIDAEVMSVPDADGNPEFVEEEGE